MKLYTRAALGVITAFVLTYAALGVTKAYYIDPDRRQIYFELNRPVLELAAAQLDSAPQDPESSERGRERLGPMFAVERLERAELAGWFVRGRETFSFRRLQSGEHLIYGPFPPIDPHEALTTVVALGVPVVLASIIAFLLVAPIIRHARALARVTQRLSEGDLSARADDRGGKDAIARLSRRINEMAAELERLVVSKKELLQAVSHEFRTPSSRIRFDLEMLADADSDQERQQRIGSIDESLVELDDLVDELLVYTRFDEKTPDLAVSDVPVSAVLHKLVSELGELRGDVQFEIAAQACTVHANERYLRRALRNLMINAARYAEGRVQVAAQVEGERVRISVTDDGPGIPAAERGRVFEPFARLEGSRGRDHGGVGLGLAIVKRICDWHGAEVVVADHATGARIVMLWPRG